MDRHDLQKVTTELEHLNSAGLPGLLHGKFLEERIAILKEIRQLNEHDRQVDDRIPSLELSINTGYAGYDTLTLNANRHNWSDEWNNGPVLYQDALSLNRLTHSTAGDVVPANRHQIDVRALTTKLEDGNGKGIGDLLAGMCEEERVRVFQEAGKLNQADLQSHKTQISLNITITPDKVGDNFISVERVKPGFHDWFFGGKLLYHDNLELNSLKRSIDEYNSQ